MTKIFKKKIESNSDDLISLAHTKWNCKYNIVFTPKYRRKIFYFEKWKASMEMICVLRHCK